MGVLQRILGEQQHSRALTETVLPPSWADQVATVTPDKAMSNLSAVFRCMQVISHMTTRLSWERYQGENLAGPFRGFAVGQTDREFLARTAVSLAGWGNAYWLKPATKLKSWKYRGVIAPANVTVRSDGTFDVFDPNTGRSSNMGPDQVTHIPFMPIPGSLIGLGPLGALRYTLGLARDLNDYASTIYTDGKYPSGVLSTDQQMPKQISQAIKDAWVAKFTGASREPAILTGGLKYEPIAISPVDAAFVEAFNLSVQDIGRAFGVPGSFMGVSSGDSLTYSTSESEVRRFIDTTLSAYSVPIEQAFSADRGTATESIEANFDSLLRVDTAARFQAYAVAQVRADGSGWMTTDEIRAAEGLSPMGGNNA